jgi:hypothetical protein
VIDVAKADLGWDVAAAAAAAPAQGIVSIFEHAITDFSKYKLAKAFLRWTRGHTLADFRAHEREAFAQMFAYVSKVLK